MVAPSLSNPDIRIQAIDAARKIVVRLAKLEKISALVHETWLWLLFMAALLLNQNVEDYSCTFHPSTS